MKHFFILLFSLVLIPAFSQNLVLNSALVIAENPSEFTNKIIQLLNNDKERNELSQNGISFIKNHFEWSSFDNKLHSEIDKLLVDW